MSKTGKFDVTNSGGHVVLTAGEWRNGVTDPPLSDWLEIERKLGDKAWTGMMKSMIDLLDAYDTAFTAVAE